MGVVAGLEHAGEPLVVLACDTPLVPPGLLAALANSPAPFAMPADPRAQPLIARYSPSLLPRLRAGLADRESLTSLAGALGGHRLGAMELREFGDPDVIFANVNDPADVAPDGWDAVPVNADSRLPPGSRMPAPLQSALFAHDPARFLEGARRRFGPVFRVRFIGLADYVYVTDPELSRRVFASDRDVGRAGDARRDFLEPVVGENSLLCMEGEDWLRHRKLLGPAFHRGHTDGYAGEIAAIASDQIARWPLDEEVELRPRMQAITLEVILRLVFGVTEESTLRRFREELPHLLEPAGGAALWLLPPSVWATDREQLLRRFPNPIGSFLRARDRVDELIYAEIARRRASPRDGGRDVLSLMLAARDENGAAMDDVELRDELVTLLEAGHETTATALAWAFERLVRNPAVLSG